MRCGQACNHSRLSPTFPFFFFLYKTTSTAHEDDKQHLLKIGFTHPSTTRVQEVKWREGHELESSPRRRERTSCDFLTGVPSCFAFPPRSALNVAQRFSHPAEEMERNSAVCRCGRRRRTPRWFGRWVPSATGRRCGGRERESEKRVMIGAPSPQQELDLSE